MKPQRTRCTKWRMVYTGDFHYGVRCGQPLTHRVVGRWLRYSGWPERELVCSQHARKFLALNATAHHVQYSAYRVRGHR